MKKKTLVLGIALSTIFLSGCGNSNIADFAPKEDLVNSKIKTIEIVSMPTKTNYEVGDYFDDTGLVLKAVFENGKSYIIPRELYDYNNGTIDSGTTSITVTYKGIETVIEITTSESSTPVSYIA